MVAESQTGALTEFLALELLGCGRKNFFVRAFPYPLDLILAVPEIRNIMLVMTNSNTLLTPLFAFAGIDEHSPPDFSRDRLLIPCRQHCFFQRVSWHNPGCNAKPGKNSKTGFSYKFSSLFVHHGVSMGDR